MALFPGVMGARSIAIGFAMSLFSCAAARADLCDPATPNRTCARLAADALAMAAPTDHPNSYHALASPSLGAAAAVWGAAAESAESEPVRVRRALGDPGDCCVRVEFVTRVWDTLEFSTPSLPGRTRQPRILNPDQAIPAPAVLITPLGDVSAAVPSSERTRVRRTNHAGRPRAPPFA